MRILSFSLNISESHCLYSLHGFKNPFSEDSFEDSFDAQDNSGAVIDDPALLTEGEAVRAEVYANGELQAETSGLQVRLVFDENAKIPEASPLPGNPLWRRWRDLNPRTPCSA